MTTVVGRSVTRVDAREKVTGTAVYGVDVQVPGMLHGAVVRSPDPHARIVSSDTTAAAAAPGVETIVTKGRHRYMLSRTAPIEEILQQARHDGEVTRFAFEPPHLTDLFREAVGR